MPPLNFQLSTLNSPLVKVWKVTESLTELAALLPDGGAMYQWQLDRFTSESRKIEYLAVRVLLYHLLGDEKEILYKFSGKPYLADRSGYISISHTKGYVAVAYSETSEEIGIDIEKRGERIHKVAHKFIRPDEEQENSPFDLTTRRLLIWSAKEVIFKCIDVSNVDFKDHLKVELPTHEKEAIRAFELRTAQKRTFTLHYFLHEDFVMTYSLPSLP